MSNQEIDKLRVAVIAGVLGKGGAEKQLFYIVSSLMNAGARVTVFSLTKNEYYEKKLIKLGIDVVWVGKSKFPFVRLWVILIRLFRFHPDLIYSTHFFSNLYAAVTGKILSVVSIGSIRNDTLHEINRNGVWGKWLLKLPTVMIANSQQAVKNAVSIGEAQERLFLLPNFINLNEFDHFSKQSLSEFFKNEKMILVIVARLVKAKRIDRFIEIFSALRQEHKNIVGWIVGSGPEYGRLKKQAEKLGLSDDELVFLGQREEVPSILQRSDIFVLTSEHEGFPNVLLEAMSAKLPIVTSPAGDAKKIVVDGMNGYVVREEDMNDFVDKINLLIGSEVMRKTMGASGRKMVENEYDIYKLDQKIMDVLLKIAFYTNNKKLLTKVQAAQERIKYGEKHAQPG